MNDLILNRSQIAALYREFVTEDEYAEYESQNEPGTQWEKLEDYMITLYKIQFSKNKLSVWMFTYDHAENYKDLFDNVSNIKGAYTEIKNNNTLRIILSYVLTVGNILNGGTPKGQADGFNLDILSKIGSVKDNTNKTLTQYICSQIKKEDDNFEGIKKDFSTLGDAVKVPLTEIQSGINKLKKDLKDNNANFEKFSQLDDDFCKKCKKLFEIYFKEVEQLDTTFQEVFKNIQELISFFGYLPTESKYKNPEEFFILINDFTNEIDRSLPKTEVKKVFKGKHEIGKKIVDGPSSQNNMDAILNQLKARSTSVDK
jgi:hypothetical protein